MTDSYKPTVLEVLRDMLFRFFWKFVFPIFLVISFMYFTSGDPTIDIDKGFGEKLGSGNWAVDNISIGDSYSDVKESVWGGPASVAIDNSGFSSAYTFNNGNTSVYFDANKRVQRVVGLALYKNEDAILEVRAHSAGWVKGKIGKGHITKHYRVKNGHILAKEKTLTAAEYRYHDGEKQRFILYFTGKHLELESVEVVVLEEN